MRKISCLIICFLIISNLFSCSLGDKTNGGYDVDPTYSFAYRCESEYSTDIEYIDIKVYLAWEFFPFHVVTKDTKYVLSVFTCSNDAKDCNDNDHKCCDEYILKEFYQEENEIYSRDSEYKKGVMYYYMHPNMIKMPVSVLLDAFNNEKEISVKFYCTDPYRGMFSYGFLYKVEDEKIIITEPSFTRYCGDAIIDK